MSNFRQLVGTDGGYRPYLIPVCPTLILIPNFSISISHVQVKLLPYLLGFLAMPRFRAAAPWGHRQRRVRSFGGI
jgi:hypothetical protein